MVQKIKSTTLILDISMLKIRLQLVCFCLILSFKYFIPHSSVFLLVYIPVRDRGLIPSGATDGEDRCIYGTIMCIGWKCPHIPYICRAL